MNYFVAVIVATILCICCFIVICGLLGNPLSVCPIMCLAFAGLSLACLFMCHIQSDLNFIRFISNLSAFFMILWASSCLHQFRFYKKYLTKDEEDIKEGKYLKILGILMLLGSITSIVLCTMNFTFTSSLLMLFTPITLLAVFKFVLKRKIEFDFY